jgi:hypothetical protein
MPSPVVEIASRAEILGLLSDAARQGHVGAMRLLLEELRRDGEDQVSAPSVIDELARKRKAEVRV